MAQQYLRYFLGAIMCLLELSVYGWVGLWRLTGIANWWVDIWMVFGQIHITVDCILFFIFIIGFCGYLKRGCKFPEDGSLGTDSISQKMDPYKLTVVYV